MNKTLFHRSVFALTLVGMLSLVLCLHGCGGKSQAQLDASNQAIKSARDENARALDLAKAAYDHAVSINDTLAAQLSQAKIDAANKTTKDLDTAQTLHDAAQAVQDAKSTNWQSLIQTGITVGGLLPPPFNLIGVIGAALVTGGVLGNKKGLATGAAALDFQAGVIEHAQTSGQSPGDITTHIETAKANIPTAVAKLYDAAPPIKLSVNNGLATV